MIVVKLIGGLGNQMFQYAFWRFLSLKHNTTLYLDLDPFYYDIREYELGIFSIDEHIADAKHRPRYLYLWKNKLLDKIQYLIIFLCKKLNPKHILENKHHPRIYPAMYNFNPEAIAKAKDWCYVEWFWESEKYFKDIEKIIKQDFTLKQELDDERNTQILEKINWCNAVSLHVRRTDYIGSDYEGICGKIYYDNAITYMKDQIKDPVFFVFSDDIARCKDWLWLTTEAYYIDRNIANNSYKDMIVMSRCNHNIIANSTFSRRWARLNLDSNKIIIAPKRFNKFIDIKDIIPEGRITF